MMQAQPVGAGMLEGPNTGLLRAIGWGASLALAVAFLVDAPVAVLWLAGAALLASGALLALQCPMYGLVFLPVTVLLGPILRVAAGPIQVNLGDAYVGMLILTVGVSMASRPLAFSPSRNLLLIATALVLISWLFSADGGDSMVAVMGFVQLLAAYVLTLNLVRTREDVRHILLSWVAAVAISCSLVVIAYLQGRMLLIGADPDAVAEMGARSSTRVLFRATFFIAPFIFTLTSALLLSVALLVLDVDTGSRRVWLFLLVPVFILTAMAMGNMSVLVGVTVGVAGIVVWSVLFPRVGRRTLGLTAGAAVIGLLVAVGTAQLVEGVQLLLLRERLSDTTSLQLRFGVWRNVVEYLGATPKVFLVGLGPDISIRSVELPVLRELFLGSGVQQEAVDNSYLYVALNLGVPALVVGLMLVVGVLWRLTKLVLRRPNALAVAIWVTVVAWLVMSVTQQSGISKPVLFLAQALALGDKLAILGESGDHRRTSNDV
jgi:hypothetical protein